MILRVYTYLTWALALFAASVACSRSGSDALESYESYRLWSYMEDVAQDFLHQHSENIQMIYYLDKSIGYLEDHLKAANRIHEIIQIYDLMGIPSWANEIEFSAFLRATKAKIQAKRKELKCRRDNHRIDSNVAKAIFEKFKVTDDQYKLLQCCRKQEKRRIAEIKDAMANLQQMLKTRAEEDSREKNKGLIIFDNSKRLRLDHEACRLELEKVRLEKIAANSFLLVIGVEDEILMDQVIKAKKDLVLVQSQMELIHGKISKSF